VDSVVFKNGNSLAVRLVGDCRLPQGTRVREYREGNRIIIEPIGGWPESFLAALGAWDEPIERPQGELRDPFEDDS
jgi:virulence-associated protein VagC